MKSKIITLGVIAFVIIVLLFQILAMKTKLKELEKNIQVQNEYSLLIFKALSAGHNRLNVLEEAN